MIAIVFIEWLSCWSMMLSLGVVRWNASLILALGYPDEEATHKIDHVLCPHFN
jgi:hypothetical protein